MKKYFPWVTGFFKAPSLVSRQSEIRDLFESCSAKRRSELKDISLFTPLIGLPMFFTRAARRRFFFLLAIGFPPTLFALVYTLITSSYFISVLLVLLTVIMWIPMAFSTKYITSCDKWGIIIPRLKLLQFNKGLRSLVNHELDHAEDLVYRMDKAS